MKICIGIILYYPSVDEINRIKNYLDVFEHVYVYDNTPDIEHKKQFHNSGIYYYFNSSNDGMSLALNFICNQAIYDGYDFIITMDQDSIISNDSLMQMQNFINTYSMKNIGIISPTIIYNQKQEVKMKVTDEIYNYISWTITSGSAINLNIYRNTSGFDENYFIDRLDYDYCILIQKLGYKIIRINNVYLYQSLGEQRKGLFKNLSTHNPIRHYYMVRNRLYFYLKKQDQSNKQMVIVILLTIKHFLSIILVENQKAQKIRMTIKGIKDYMKNNMGKIRDI